MRVAGVICYLLVRHKRDVYIKYEYLMIVAFVFKEFEKY